MESGGGKGGGRGLVDVGVPANACVSTAYTPADGAVAQTAGSVDGEHPLPSNRTRL